MDALFTSAETRTFDVCKRGVDHTVATQNRLAVEQIRSSVGN